MGNTTFVRQQYFRCRTNVAVGQMSPNPRELIITYVALHSWFCTLIREIRKWSFRLNEVETLKSESKFITVQPTYIHLQTGIQFACLHETCVKAENQWVKHPLNFAAPHWRVGSVVPGLKKWLLYEPTAAPDRKFGGRQALAYDWSLERSLRSN